MARVGIQTQHNQPAERPLLLSLCPPPSLCALWVKSFPALLKLFLKPRELLPQLRHFTPQFRNLPPHPRPLPPITGFPSGPPANVLAPAFPRRNLHIPRHQMHIPRLLGP